MTKMQTKEYKMLLDNKNKQNNTDNNNFNIPFIQDQENNVSNPNMVSTVNQNKNTKKIYSTPPIRLDSIHNQPSPTHSNNDSKNNNSDNDSKNNNSDNDSKNNNSDNDSKNNNSDNDSKNNNLLISNSITAPQQVSLLSALNIQPENIKNNHNDDISSDESHFWRQLICCQKFTYPLIGKNRFLFYLWSHFLNKCPSAFNFQMFIQMIQSVKEMRDHKIPSDESLEQLCITIFKKGVISLFFTLLKGISLLISKQHGLINKLSKIKALIDLKDKNKLIVYLQEKIDNTTETSQDTCDFYHQILDIINHQNDSLLEEKYLDTDTDTYFTMDQKNKINDLVNQQIKKHKSYIGLILFSGILNALLISGGVAGSCKLASWRTNVGKNSINPVFKTVIDYYSNLSPSLFVFYSYKAISYYILKLFPYDGVKMSLLEASANQISGFLIGANIGGHHHNSLVRRQSFFTGIYTTLTIVSSLLLIRKHCKRKKTILDYQKDYMTTEDFFNLNLSFKNASQFMTFMKDITIDSLPIFVKAAADIVTTLLLSLIAFLWCPKYLNLISLFMLAFDSMLALTLTLSKAIREFEKYTNNEENKEKTGQYLKYEITPLLKKICNSFISALPIVTCVLYIPYPEIWKFFTPKTPDEFAQSFFASIALLTLMVDLCKETIYTPLRVVEKSGKKYLYLGALFNLMISLSMTAIIGIFHKELPEKDILMLAGLTFFIGDVSNLLVVSHCFGQSNCVSRHSYRSDEAKIIKKEASQPYTEKTQGLLFENDPNNYQNKNELSIKALQVHPSPSFSNNSPIA